MFTYSHANTPFRLILIERAYYLINISILEKRMHFVYMLVNKEISISQKGLFIEGDLLKSHA